MRSLSARLLIAVSLLLLFFFGFAIVALELAFRDSTEQAIKDRLDVQMLMLIAAADADENGRLYLPEQLPEARFMSPGSGLVGQVIGKEDELIWRSLSAVGSFLPIEPVGLTEDTRFQRATSTDGTDMFSYSLAVEWELSTGEYLVYTFSVAESAQSYLDQVGKFRERLITLFGLIMALLLASQAVVLRWVLKPLRQVAQEIEEIESADRTTLSPDYPSELHGLTRNTNRLIEAERKRLSRYRNTLGNLAHSLKTPLAIVRNTLEQYRLVPEAEQQIHQQVDQMSDIVGYQLQRAAASGGMTLGLKKIDVNLVVEAIVDSLQKVYADKNVQCQIDAPATVYYRIEKGDLMEIFGNLLDNAFKWCKTSVKVSLENDSKNGTEGTGMVFKVCDDGSGISAKDVKRVLRRGQRADETVDGHGIGLSVVRELLELLEGELHISPSSLGGACLHVVFPAK